MSGAGFGVELIARLPSGRLYGVRVKDAEALWWVFLVGKHHKIGFDLQKDAKLHWHRPQTDKVSETLFYAVRICCGNSGTAGSPTFEPMLPNLGT